MGSATADLRDLPLKLEEADVWRCLGSGIVPLGPSLKVKKDPDHSHCRYLNATRCPMDMERPS
jgi:hypothetical protein